MSSINEKTTELSKLLIPHRSTPVMQRINAFFVQETGHKLTDFLANGDSEEKKIELLDRIILIAQTGDFDKLPQVVAGQAAAAPTPRPVPAPKPPKKEEPAAPDLVTTAAKPTPTPALAALVEASEPAAEEEPDPTAAIAAILTKMQQKTKPAMTQEEIRAFVRTEVRRQLADIMTTIATVLSK